MSLNIENLEGIPSEKRRYCMESTWKYRRESLYLSWENPAAERIHSVKMHSRSFGAGELGYTDTGKHL